MLFVLLLNNFKNKKNKENTQETNIEMLLDEPKKAKASFGLKRAREQNLAWYFYLS